MLNLEDLGITKEELQTRVVEHIADNILSDMEGYTERVENRLQKEMEKRINAAVEDIGNRLLLPTIVDMVEKLCIQDTNIYGEKKGEPKTFVEYLTERADIYLREKVDHDGKSKGESNGYSWDGKQTRLTHIVHRHLQHSIQTAMTNAVSSANKSIEGGLQEAVNIKLKEIAGQIKVNVTVPK